jgi:transglutaminase/protease-like cytokinesis protein 3
MLAWLLSKFCIVKAGFATNKNPKLHIHTKAMRSLFTFLFLLFMKLAFSQGQSLNFSYIDRKVQSVESSSPEQLAQKLTSSYTTDLEKLRSIFRWITENIAYRTGNYARNGKYKSRHVVEEIGDTLDQSGSLNERIALEVLKKREAVCDGYSRLFKFLCDYAGLRCEIITGYASNMGKMGSQFKSNHRWNAVLLDSAWHLMDVTWASGYITYTGNQFIKSYDDHYFLTPPEDFIRDHYPEDSRWTLLSNPPTLQEFYRTPFKHSAFSKYSILSFAPAKGVIEAAIGDTVKVELTLADMTNREIAPDTLKDDLDILPQVYASNFLKSSGNDKQKITYSYPVSSKDIEWLNVVFNDDVILRYKLNIRKNKEE